MTARLRTPVTVLFVGLTLSLTAGMAGSLADRFTPAADFHDGNPSMYLQTTGSNR